jgi:hypothetical protein
VQWQESLGIRAVRVRHDDIRNIAGRGESAMQRNRNAANYYFPVVVLIGTRAPKRK